MCKAEVGCQWTHILNSFPNTTTPPPFSTSLFQLKQSGHYKEEQQHLSLALTAFSVHPVRISRNMESYNNMEHHIGWMSFPSAAVGNTGGCKESMWSCLVEIRNLTLTLKMIYNWKQLADQQDMYRIQNRIYWNNVNSEHLQVQYNWANLICRWGPSDTAERSRISF